MVFASLLGPDVYNLALQVFRRYAEQHDNLHGGLGECSKPGYQLALCIVKVAL